MVYIRVYVYFVDTVKPLVNDHFWCTTKVVSACGRGSLTSKVNKIKQKLNWLTNYIKILSSQLKLCLGKRLKALAYFTLNNA